MIEGAQSSLSDLLLIDLDQEPGVLLDDVREASDYVAAPDQQRRLCSTVGRRSADVREPPYS